MSQFSYSGVISRNSVCLFCILRLVAATKLLTIAFSFKMFTCTTLKTCVTFLYRASDRGYLWDIVQSILHMFN